LLEKYTAKPASKRVNFINNGFLNPFYCPFNSLVADQKKTFFILRNQKFLLKLKTYFFNSNNQNKLNKEKILDELKSIADNFDEILSSSYVNVRITAFEKGTVAPYSQIYELSDENLTEKNLDFSLFKQTMISVKKKMKLENEAKINEIDNEEFFKLNLEELNKSNKTEKLVGFVINSKFSLVNGLNAANAAIRTNYIIDSILNEKENKSLKNTVLYRTPSSVKYNLAKINNFYN
jgi:hypothetical protein